MTVLRWRSLRRLTLVLALGILGATVASAQPPGTPVEQQGPWIDHDGDHPELLDMFTREQAIRAEITAENLREKLKEMAAIDKANRARLIAIASAGELETAYDFYRAAIMFAHQTVGDDVANMQLALEYAITSMRLGCPDAPYTVARTYDRLLLTLGRGQRYGTQYGPDSQLRPFDDGIVPMSDTVRAQLDVPPRG